MSLKTFPPAIYESTFFEKHSELRNLRTYSYETQPESPRPTVSAIPLIHTQLSNKPDIRRRLAVRRDKYLVSLSAVGADSIEVLKNMNKMRKLPMIKKFEFDPYMCEESGVIPLKMVNNKLRRVREVRYTLRRLDCEESINGLFTPIHKFIGLDKLKIELPNTLEIDNDTYKKILKAIHNKCYALKSYDLKINGLETVSEKTVVGAYQMPLKMKKLEHYNINIVKKQKFSDKKVKCNYKRPDKTPLQKLRSFSTVFGITSSGWNAATCNNCPALFMATLRDTINPEKAAFKFLSARFGEIQNEFFGQMIAKQTNLRDFSIDIVGSELEDENVISAVKTLTRYLHLKKITFKYTQRPCNSNLAEQSIIEIINVISKASHLDKFDIYLRNILLETEEKCAVNSRLALLSDDIKYRHLERSLHIYKSQ